MNSAKGLIKLQNDDNECFRWCHIRHLNPQEKDPQRIKNHGVEFPVTIKQIPIIERQNSINVKVFGYENKKPYPVYVSKQKYGDTMNLLLITHSGGDIRKVESFLCERV